MKHRFSQNQQLMLALVPPLVALGVQWTLWFWLKPLVVLLFYPAVFLSSWIGGRRGGLAGTALSMGLIWYFFMPPQFSFEIIGTHMVVALAVFGGMGALFSLLHEKLRTTNEMLRYRLSQGTSELRDLRNFATQGEARMAAVVASAMDAIISVDSHQNVVLFNAAAETMFGCSAAEALGKPLDMFIPQKFREAHRHHVTEFGHGGTTSRSMGTLGTLNAVRASGEEFPIEASISHAEVGGQKTYTVIIRDITERAKAEKTSSLLAAIVESSSDAIISKDLNSIILSWNAGAERMFGFSALEMVGRSITQIIPPSRLDEEDIILGKIRQGERVEHFETLRLNKAGSQIAVSVTVSPIKDEFGNVVGASKVAHDITERQKTQTALRESERRFSDMLRDVQLASVMLDTEGHVTYCNDYFLRLTGWTEAEVVGQDYFALFIPFDAADLRPVFRQVLDGLAAAVHHKNEIVTRTGERRLIRWNNTLLRSPDGGVAGTASIGEDITEQQLAESALRTKQVHSQSLLRLTRRLERAENLADILAATGAELSATLGFHHAWFYVFSEDRRYLHLVSANYRGEDLAEAHSVPLLLIEGDPMLEEIASAEDLVLVEDARTDPRTDKEIVARLGNRTIVNMPVSLSGRKLGVIGTGTFGEEGVRVLTMEERDFFAAVASHVAAIVDRVQALEKRQRAEIALRESEARFSKAFHASPAPMCITTIKEGRFIEVNERYCQIFDLTRQELIGQTSVALALWADPAVRVLVMKRLRDHGSVRGYETQFRPKTGSLLEALISMELIEFPGEKEPVVVSMFADITERKRAEAEISALNAGLEQRVAERTAQLAALNVELHDSRAELQSLFESLPGLYLVLTPAWKIVGVSDAFLKATMTTRESILGLGLFEVFPDNPDDPSADGESNLAASLNRVLQTGESDTMAIQRYDVRRPDGVFEERYWSPINSPVVGADRHVQYLIHRVEEVTAFVRSRTRSPGGHAALSARMEQMEAEIYQSGQKVHAARLQLEAANQQLEAANKELESFSYSVSHDLRAPLRAMDGFSRAVLEDHGEQLPEEGRRHLQIIRSNAKKMGHLIDDLLTFSRLSRMPLRRQQIDVVNLVEMALEDLRNELAGREADLRIGPLPPCLGDPSLLKQVWVNLLSNALKYSRRRTAAVILVGCEVANGRNTYFVRDNGAGFDMRYASKLFGVFQRLHRAEDYEGTGVGLAIVHRVVHRHGGRVWAESVPGEQTTFYFTLEESSATL